MRLLRNSPRSWECAVGGNVTIQATHISSTSTPDSGPVAPGTSCRVRLLSDPCQIIIALCPSTSIFISYRLFMDIRLCGWTAFQYMRVPPVVRELEAWLVREPAASELIATTGDGSWRKGIEPCRQIAAPLDHLATAERERLRGKGVRSHLLTGVTTDGLTRSVSFSLPKDGGAKRVTHITSPAATLLTMAGDLGSARLALATSEAMGSFAVFSPNPLTQSILDALVRKGVHPSAISACSTAVPQRIRNLARYGSWKQAYAPDGTATNLWRRPPLLTKDNLDEFVCRATGMRGTRTLAQAADLAHAGTASPLEAQAAVLLSAPQRKGGEGLVAPRCNHPVRLDYHASVLAGQRICYCDLFYSQPSLDAIQQGGADRNAPLQRKRSKRAVDVECHSTIWHAHPEKSVSDIKRVNGLEAMGVRTLLLTRDVLANSYKMHEFTQEIWDEMGLRRKRHSKELTRRRDRLRQEVLVRWENFGVFC